ncbi:hypothetical protein POM88_044548 [Heracleum sosnowskyi]|uniref:Uncharacterized protein n=1 Tax=Heracleum sosnowskyi TaxID=360622 RepID=A0AAD8H5L1_9APIA|nr:hypothetical protein POM88_044548 [Heracleum sosnowskyi]
MSNHWMLFMISLILFGGFSSSSAAPPASEYILITHVKIEAVTGRSLVKFEGGYTVETLFYRSKHGIEPYSVELSPTGDLLALKIIKTDEPLLRPFDDVRAADLWFSSDLWDHILVSAKDLISGMLCVDPSKRLTAKQL